ncbi:MAG: glycosyltransferase [Pseudomonadota bacterium]
MTFLLLGSGYFQKALADLGHDVAWAGTDPGCDPRLEEKDLDIPRIIAKLGRKIQAVILTDDLGRRVFPSGLERTQGLKVYYGVDGPLNFFWQRHFASLFDLVALDQKSTAEMVPGAFWLPVGVETGLYQGPPEEPVHDIGFVGVVDPRVRPRRSNIISLLSRHFEVKTAGGRQNGWTPPREAARLYRRSRMALNENLFPGFTTRLLEGPAAGALVFTEGDSPGLADFFVPNEDLAVYGPEDILETARAFLSDHGRRKRVAARGREKVMAGHDVKNRARTLLDLIAAARPGTGLADPGPFSDKLGQALLLAGLRWPGQDGGRKLSRAETLLTRADRLDAADRETMFSLGALALIKGDAAAARSRLRRAADQGSIRAQVALGFLDGPEDLKTAARTTDLEAGPGTASAADLHFQAGLILEKAGHDLTPGFSRQGLAPVMWDALEHYLAAIRLTPDRVEPLVRLGELLARRGACCEARPFLEQAWARGGRSTGLARLLEETKIKGYQPSPDKEKKS